MKLFNFSPFLSENIHVLQWTKYSGEWKLLWYKILLSSTVQYLLLLHTSFLTYRKLVQFSSVTQACPTLCDTMNRSTPGLPVHHQLPPNLCPLSWWCHSAISSSVILFSSCPQSSPASGSFPMSQLFASGGQSIGVSVSGSVLSMNIQGWFPSGLSSLSSLLSKAGKFTVCWDKQLHITSSGCCLGNRPRWFISSFFYPSFLLF